MLGHVRQELAEVVGPGGQALSAAVIDRATDQPMRRTMRLQQGLDPACLNVAVGVQECDNRCARHLEAAVARVTAVETLRRPEQEDSGITLPDVLRRSVRGTIDEDDFEGPARGLPL